MVTFDQASRRSTGTTRAAHVDLGAPVHASRAGRVRVRHILNAPQPQAKLTIGPPGDVYEQEADRVADQVMRMPDPVASSDAVKGMWDCVAGDRRVQRRCVEHAIHRSSPDAAAAPAVTPALESFMCSLSGTGQALSRSSRAFFEPRFGRDLSAVRLHTAAAAADATRAVRALAFTLGSDIVLSEAAFAPDTPSGRRLLAHELTHVVQQDLGRDATGVKSTLTLSPADARVQRVQLTYDDGPDTAGNTRIVLDELNAAGAKATFYLVGKRVAQGDNWRLVFDIAAAGHWLGNHAYDWNDTKDDHVWLRGTATERAEKILQTEWAIRDALIQGRDDAQKKKSWDSIPAPNRDYITDVIAHGTGRFRTPGFRSKLWDKDGSTTLGAIGSVNEVLAATGLRPLAITELSKVGPDYEGVTVDPKDFTKGRTQEEIESAVKGGLGSDADSILLHSRVKATASATPAIVADIKARKLSFDPTVVGTLGSKLPQPPFAHLSHISSPPTSAEIGTARAWLQKNKLNFGPYVSGQIAIRIFQMAQQAERAEVTAFVSEIKATTIKTPEGDLPMANWMNANPEWSLFTTFFENWMTERPFPRIKGVTL